MVFIVCSRLHTAVQDAQKQAVACGVLSGARQPAVLFRYNLRYVVGASSRLHI